MAEFNDYCLCAASKIGKFLETITSIMFANLPFDHDQKYIKRKLSFNKLAPDL